MTDTTDELSLDEKVCTSIISRFMNLNRLNFRPKVGPASDSMGFVLITKVKLDPRLRFCQSATVNSLLSAIVGTTDIWANNREWRKIKGRRSDSINVKEEYRKHLALTEEWKEKKKNYE